MDDVLIPMRLGLASPDLTLEYDLSHAEYRMRTYHVSNFETTRMFVLKQL